MKKFMLRGYADMSISDYMPKSLKYGVWYSLVTPFDWQYFRLKRGFKRVEICDYINGEADFTVVGRKKFLELLTWAKSPPSESYINEDGDLVRIIDKNTISIKRGRKRGRR